MNTQNKKGKAPKTVKILLPGIMAKALKNVGIVIQPHMLVTPMVITGVMAQIADNLKGACTPKEVQQLESMKTYSKALGVGDSRQLCATHAVANTLGPELSTLATLTPEGRVQHLEALVETTCNEKGPAKVKTSALVSKDQAELATHRRGLALQSRSFMQSIPIFNKTQMTIGVAIKDLNLATIIESARQLWLNIGGDADAFEPKLIESSGGAQTVTEAVIRIVQENLQMLGVVNTDDILVHSGDILVLKGEDNITPIERDLGFIRRSEPSILDPVEVPQDVQVDPILKAAMEQNNQLVTAVTNSLQKSGKAKGVAKPPLPNPPATKPKTAEADKSADAKQARRSRRESKSGQNRRN